jgi:hypothetical protein
MIRVFRDVSRKYPSPSYTEAVCDRCGSACPTSHVAGTTLAATEEAIEAAWKAGWVERGVRAGGPGKRKMTWTVELLCPDCAVEVAKEATT